MGFKGLNHFNNEGEAHMVNVGDKEDTNRVAKAKGTIYMKKETKALVKEGRAKKGDVLSVARLAGIMAAKKTADLIPLCHNISLSGVEVDFNISEEKIEVFGEVHTQGKTGAEMEALTAVSVACLTIYDMLKAVDRDMTIGDIKLVYKAGGKSGTYSRDA